MTAQVISTFYTVLFHLHFNTNRR